MPLVVGESFRIPVYFSHFLACFYRTWVQNFEREVLLPAMKTEFLRHLPFLFTLCFPAQFDNRSKEGLFRVKCRGCTMTLGQSRTGKVVDSQKSQKVRNGRCFSFLLTFSVPDPAPVAEDSVAYRLPRIPKIGPTLRPELHSLRDLQRE